eukprot:scaffold430371_cov17-Prasinocladus_malaysianus.AAC.1
MSVCPVTQGDRVSCCYRQVSVFCRIGLAINFGSILRQHASRKRFDLTFFLARGTLVRESMVIQIRGVYDALSGRHI